MASITIRNLDDAVKKRLRLRAAEHGRSMEEEVREILGRETKKAPAPAPKTGLDLFRGMREAAEKYGGVDLEPFPREPLPGPRIFRKAVKSRK